MTLNPARRAVLVMRTEHPSVLAIKVDELCFDHDNPWKREPSTLRGFAICVGPTLLLVPAHLVEDATEAPQQDDDDPPGVLGTVTAINHDVDLALIELSKSDAIGLVPLELGDLVAPGDDVMFHGASQVSGTVTKVDVQRCSASARYLLLASVRFFGLDKGGGGVTANHKLVGLCIQRLKDDDDIFDMVPAPLIRHFLAGCLELPGLCVTTQNTNNAQLRKAMRLHDDEGGMLVIDTDHGSPAAAVLQRDDVILVIDGRDVSRDGMVGETRVRYDVTLGTHRIGDVIELVIKRRGARMTVQLPLGRWQPLVPRHRHGAPPRYLVFGGFVFQQLTRDYLLTWDDWWNNGPKEFLDAYYRGRATPQQQELVVLTQILEDPLTDGYAHLYNEGVRSVNGAVPRTFADFTALLASSIGTVRIEMTSEGVILLDAEQARRETPRICAVYGIPRDRTPGLPR